MRAAAGTFLLLAAACGATFPTGGAAPPARGASAAAGATTPAGEGASPGGAEAPGGAGAQPRPTTSVLLEDDFAAPLDAQRWLETGTHDAAEALLASGADGSGQGGLRLGLDTIGTDDETVKFVGVVSRNPLDLARPVRISVDLDWGDRVNASYLSAAIFIAGGRTEETPEALDDWLKLEYIGVPPAGKGRSLLALRRAGRVKVLSNDGWPENREGRTLGVLRVELVLDGDRLTVLENGSPLFRSEGLDLDIRPAHLYLQMSSHSNYPLRPVTFLGVRVEPL